MDAAGNEIESETKARAGSPAKARGDDPPQAKGDRTGKARGIGPAKTKGRATRKPQGDGSAQAKGGDAGKPQGSEVSEREPGPLPGVAAPLPRGGAEELRRTRARQLLARFGLFVMLPTMMGAAYFGAVASDQYVSVSPFMVQSADGSASMSLESLIGAIPGSSSVKDALAVREYVLSRDVLARLDKDQGFIAHYKDPSADWFSRLPQDATFEETFEYYLDKVEVDYDTLSGVLKLQVRAYAPDRATAFATAILEYSEQMVNSLAERARLDAIAFAKSELETAEERLVEARKAVLEIQTEGADINPEQSATAAMAIRSELQGQLAAARAELSQARAFMRPDAPQVIGLQQKVSSLSQQVSRQNRVLVSPEQEGLNTSVARFEEVMLEKEFAQAMYQSAVSSLELARAEASRQHRYLATIAPPSSADEPTYPARWLGVLAVFVVSLAVFGIGSLLIAAVREHARI